MTGFILAMISFIASLPMCVAATHYGVSYQDKQMSCEGSGTYDSGNPAIIARGYYSPFECGAKLAVIGPHGTIIGYIEDRCPGCGSGLDLSEAGHEIVCGPGGGTCDVIVERIP